MIEPIISKDLYFGYDKKNEVNYSLLETYNKDDFNPLNENIRNPFLYDEMKDNTLFGFDIEAEDYKKEGDNKIIINLPKDNKVNNYFTISKTEIESTEYTHKKRGKKKTKFGQKYHRIHTNSSADNIKTKIQVHYTSFIVSYLNEILKNFNYTQRFYDIEAKLKKANKETFESVKEKPIWEIINNRITSKYSTRNKDHNKIAYEMIKKEKNEVLHNILSENYIMLFKKIYYKNKKVINLKEYGVDKIITLSNKVKTYEDLLKKQEKGLNKGCKRFFDNCIKRNYLTENIFILN